MPNLIERLGREILFFDGAMGTMLQARGLKPGDLPEELNLTSPEIVRDIHKEYLSAGCDILKTNTFGANCLKLGPAALSVEKTVHAAVKIAKDAIADMGRPAYVAVSIGPTGRLLKPYGDLDFLEAQSIFAEIAAAADTSGADMILIETLTDLYEVKAALLAAKSVSTLPVAVTMAFDLSGRLLTGADVLTAATLVQALGTDAMGFNCGLGPKQMLSLLPALRENSRIPIIVNPNAGLPEIIDGQTQFLVGPEEFADDMQKIVEGGASVVGGCCGTTPAHIRALRNALAGHAVQAPAGQMRTIITSYASSVIFGKKPVLIGERINPTGKSAMKRALRENDMGYILSEGAKQTQAGADILDVNVGLPGIDETEFLCRAVRELQGILTTPLQLDTSNPESMEQAARIYNGRPLLNSVNGKRESMETILPIAKKYGGVLIALTLDEGGIPDTAKGRVRVAEKILREAEKYGLGPETLVFDALAMSVSTGGGALSTLDALFEIRHRLGCHTALGVSNISFGLPDRARLNAAFFTTALSRGLSAGIINPLNGELMDAYTCHNVLTGYDANCMGYISRFSAPEGEKEKSPAPAAAKRTLYESVVAGMKEEANACAVRALQTREPMDIIDNELVPALNEVGKGFEKGNVFLPQLLMSADAAKAAFQAIREKIAASGAPKEGIGKIVIATVKDDVHDIGKNIVRALLENYGYDVIDLGKDVPPETVVETVLKEGAPLVGLSALMTTTVKNMAETIRLLKDQTSAKVMVGGAVLTESYAHEIGADFYARDAMTSVHFANRFFGRE